MTIIRLLHLNILIQCLVAALSQSSSSSSEINLLGINDRVAFGTLRFEMRSKSTVEPRVFLSEVVARTSNFLDAEMQRFFTDIAHDGSFTHCDLGIVDFTIDKNNSPDYVLATVDLDASAYFSANPVPSPEFMTEVTTSIFQGLSLSSFFNLLKQSNGSFLSDITYLLVDLNGEVIVTKDMSQTVPQKSEEANEKTLWETLWDENLYIVIAAVASCAGVFIFSVVLYLTCCRKNGSRRNSKYRVQTVRSNRTAEDDEESAQSPPSPVHSICSQASSIFTYNPGYYHVSDSNSKTLATQVSVLDSKAQNVDDPEPFEADISVIELNQKDLSLVVEEDRVQKMLDLSLSEPKQLTAAALKGIGTKMQTNQWKTNEDSYCSAELSLFQSETSDVIDDLTNLS
eukprot:CAMPEP_0194236914 /NCGR_PEP_ID=MMETSP0158-20130606/4070_1 /TAXON_ID=33649 /ORGANISM="Thalassionema nitzschioides, Strain L26-B" /LENGTH=398 /DNA_ID=CAMNT_0038970811 /DNA_START=31 /DNA_END=1223 /DNA_ORIENTATION=-